MVSIVKPHGRVWHRGCILAVVSSLILVSASSSQATRSQKQNDPRIQTIKELKIDLQADQDVHMLNAASEQEVGAILMLQIPQKHRHDAMPYLYHVDTEDLGPDYRLIGLRWISPNKHRIPPFEVLNLQGQVVGRFPGTAHFNFPLNGSRSLDPALWIRGTSFIPVYKGEKASAIPGHGGRFPKIKLNVKSLRYVSGVEFVKDASHCLPRFVLALRGIGVKTDHKKNHPLLPTKQLDEQATHTRIKDGLIRGISSKAALAYLSHHKFKCAVSSDGNIIYAIRKFDFKILGQIPVLVIVHLEANQKVQNIDIHSFYGKEDGSGVVSGVKINEP